jgi:hypothetical protein
MLDDHIVNSLRKALVLHLKENSASADWRNALITYGSLVAQARLDVPARAISQHLTKIGDDCSSLPRLDVLVIRKRTGKPGKNFGSDWEQKVKSCQKNAHKYSLT